MEAVQEWCGSESGAVQSKAAHVWAEAVRRSRRLCCSGSDEHGTYADRMQRERTLAKLLEDFLHLLAVTEVDRRLARLAATAAV